MRAWELATVSIWMAALCAYDLRELRLPNWLLALGLGLAGGYAVLNGHATVALWGLVVGLAVMLLISKPWPFGAGDHKLAAVAGAFLGPTVIAAGIGLALFAVAGWIAWRRPNEEVFPFSPFLFLGLVVAYGALGHS